MPRQRAVAVRFRNLVFGKDGSATIYSYIMQMQKTPGKQETKTE